MTDEVRRLAIQRFRLALELHETGVDMMRAKLRRDHPGEDDAAIRARLNAWLRIRPGAEHGDAEGVPGTWPREGS